VYVKKSTERPAPLRYLAPSSDMTRMTGSTEQDASGRHGRRLIALACGLTLALVPTAHARLGDLDPAFDGDGVVTPNVGTTTSARFEGITTRGDGRPVVAGWANAGDEDAVVMQLTTGGGPDSGFGETGPGLTRITDQNARMRLNDLALDDQGRVLAVGFRQAVGGTAPVLPIALRLDVQGVREDNLPEVIGGIAAGEAHAVEPLADGKVLVAGHANVNGIDEFFVARLNPTGALDTTFSGNGIAETSFGGGSRALAMALTPDGDIVLAGWAIGPTGQRQPALASFNGDDGTPDVEFSDDGRIVLSDVDPGELHAVQVDGAGRITAAGISGFAAFVTRRTSAGTADFSTFANVQDRSPLHGLVLDGARTVTAGGATLLRDTSLLLGSLDAAGTPEPALGGVPPGWRSFPGAGEALGASLGPGGTLYAAGVLGNQPYISRHLPNAAPTAALNAPAQVFAGAPAAFDAGGSSDPEGEQLSYAFDLDGNGTYEFDGGTNPVALRSFPAPGGYAVGVQVTDPRGASATATRAITVVAAPFPPPQPVLGKQGVAKPLRGIVRYRLPGTRRFLRLVELTAIPNGTEIDARKGRLLITVLHDASGQLDGARFYGGRFVFSQGQGKTPITTLTLTGGSFKDCMLTAEGSAPAMISSVKGGTGTRSTRRVRKLWGSGRGRFRTRGRYGAATVRGTKWLTLDRCDGTKLRVVHGKVSVQDLLHPNRRPKLVSAGRKTFIPYKRGG
jgi:uncharacterized delta-60 repeat protein